MRLTVALLKRKMPNGNIWLGKHRLAHKIYPVNIERMTKKLQIEDKNMLLLRHPYLTPEQEYGSTAAFKTKKDWMDGKRLDYASARLVKSVRIEDSFNALLNGNKWEI